MNYYLIINVLIIDLLAIISPGPDFFVILRNSLTQNKKAGIYTALGISLGSLWAFVVTIAGIKAIFNHPLLKIVLGVVCAGYLIYLGVHSLIAKLSKHNTIHAHQSHTHNIRYAKYFANGLLTNLFNAKQYLFLFAIMTYAQQQHASLLDNSVIAVLSSINVLLWFSFVATIMGHSKIQRLYFKQENIINKLIGLILISLGVIILKDTLVLILH